jgi:hypothetical protein
MCFGWTSWRVAAVAAVAAVVAAGLVFGAESWWGRSSFGGVEGLFGACVSRR